MKKNLHLVNLITTIVAVGTSPFLIGLMLLIPLGIFQVGLMVYIIARPMNERQSKLATLYWICLTLFIASVVVHQIFEPSAFDVITFYLGLLLVIVELIVCNLATAQWKVTTEKQQTNDVQP